MQIPKKELNKNTKAQQSVWCIPCGMLRHRVRSVAKHLLLRTFIVIFLCALSTYAFAQQDEPEVFIIIDNLPIHKECAKIKSKQEKHECTQIKLKEFISKNTNYPEVPDSINFNGYIEVYFVIGEDGEILQDRTKALGNFSGEFADLFTAEALRVINSIPNLIPANKGEKFHRVQYTLPVIFKK